MGLENFSNSIPVQQLPRKDNGSVEESDNEQREQLTKFHESENFERNYLLILETLAFKLYGSQELDKNTDKVWAMLGLICANICVGILWSGFVAGAVILFRHVDGEDSYLNESFWMSLSYTLSLFSTTGDGKIVCVSSNCQLLTVYVGLGGILLSFTFIALTAVTLSHFWSAALRSMCGCLGPDSCMTKMAVGCYTLLLLFLWFIVSIMLPSLVFWLWDPWKDSDQYYPNRGFVQYHYAVFITVLSVGFGDMSLVPLSYCSIEYGFCMFAHAFLGSILAFVARFLSDERTVISDYYLHDDETGTATTSYRVTSEQESIPQYRGVII